MKRLTVGELEGTMERLTEEKQIGPFAALKDKAEAVPGAFGSYDCLYAHMVAVTLLKEYEDTGLEPEEVKEHEAAYTEIMTRTYGPLHQKIGQWLQAEKDGRLVVLPCKVGTPVWEIGDFDGGNLKRRPFSVEDMSFWRFGITVFLTREEAEAALKKREEPVP